MKFISSLQNPLIKEILLLQQKSRARKQQGQFVCEGWNEVKLCAGSGHRIYSIFYCSENISEEEISETFGSKSELIELSKEVFNKIAYRDEVRNIIAMVKSRESHLADLNLPENPLLLVVEAVEKPGNLGALLRSADAAGVDAVLLADPLSDIYNPNVIRSSVGCVFTVPLAIAGGEEIKQFLAQKKIKVFTTFMDNAVSAWHADFKGAAAIVVGTESTGLSANWVDADYTNINIPMFGKVDSMNVSVAAALLVFEAVRQRRIR